MNLPELGQFENDTVENRLKYTAFCVECYSSHDQHELWAQYSGKGMIDYVYNLGGSKGEHVYQKYWVNWEQISPGWLITVGYDNKRPVCISANWARIEGKLVMFYYPTSVVVNHDMIIEWLNENFIDKKYDSGRSCMIDMQEFNSCVNYLKRTRE